MTFAAGTRLGPYEVIRLLGEGGMGVVYEARDTRLGRDVAVKVLPQSYAENEARLKRFEQEARSASQLNHPNILTVFDVGRHEGIPYIVSELLEGETLTSRLVPGAMAWRNAVSVASEVARGLAAAHARGIVHRDLKPDNIFITRDGRVKILDFGLAKLVESPVLDTSSSDEPTKPRMTESGVVLGTVGYMSPEQARSERLDARSDVFALGVVLHEMLSGTSPFRRDTAAETLHAILNEEPPELSGEQLPTPLVRIVEHCLEKSPENRFQSARDLAFDLETALALSTSAASTAAPHRRRAPLAWVLAGATIVAALLLGAYWAGLGGPVIDPSPTEFQRLTFRRGVIWRTRFAPDGETIFYSATWQGQQNQLYSTRAASPEARPLGQPDTDVLDVSPTGEMALALDPSHVGGLLLGTLAVMPIDGAAPRPVLENVRAADWPREGGELAVVHVVEDRARIEYPIGQVLYEAADPMIQSMRVSPRGDQIAFAARGSVILVDRRGETQVLTTGWTGVMQLAWSPRGDGVWFSAAKGGFRVSTYEVTLDGEERLVAWDVEIQDVARSGKMLLLDFVFHKGITFRTFEGTERDLSWLDWGHVADISEDGKTLLFTEAGEGGGPTEAVYLRPSDGGPAVRLGDGIAQSLAPDGSSALVIRRLMPRYQLVAVPTGTGAEEILFEADFDTGFYSRGLYEAEWFPNGDRILLTAPGVSGSPRTFVLPRSGGTPTPVTPEGVYGSRLTPDGEWFLARDADETWILWPVDGEEPRVAPGLTRDDTPVQWSEDGRFLYVRRDFGENPNVVEVYRLDITSGERELFMEYVPDPIRVSESLPLVMTPDGRFFAYTYARSQYDLYLGDPSE